MLLRNLKQFPGQQNSSWPTDVKPAVFVLDVWQIFSVRFFIHQGIGKYG
jgi:hypothetical protein